MSSPVPDWDAFVASVQKRMEAGAKEYGDQSFFKPAPKLFSEIREEIEDIMGWSYFLWRKCNEAESHFEELAKSLAFQKLAQAATNSESAKFFEGESNEA